MLPLSRILAVICLLLPALVSAAPDEASTQHQLQQLQSRLKQLTAEMQKKEGESRDLSKALQESEQRSGRLARQIRTLDQQLSSLGGRETQLERQRQSLRQDLQQRAQLLEKQLVARYKAGEQPRLQLLLNQRDPEALDRMLRYYDILNDLLSQEIQQFRKQLQLLGSTETELDQTRASIVSKQQQLRQELADLEAVRGKRKQHLAQLNQSLSQGDKKIRQLKLDQQRLQAVLREIEASFNVANLVTGDTPFKSRRGKLAWPVTGALKLVFGSMQNNISYDGIWIQGREGQPVRAVHHGRVVFADWLRGYGLVIILDHGDGYMTLYGYNQSLLFEPGDWVSAGDTIATVGDSGGRQNSGLYFALRYQGKAVDPVTWLSRRK